jgi:alanine-glyoxylate transaminase/serine-glyoxylate transaminase/serine-pyruvate transaminase
VVDGLRFVFQTTADVVIYPSSGSGAWESALVNTLSPGDTVLFVETGHFAMQWRSVAERLGFEVQLIPGNWRQGVDPADVERTLAADPDGTIKAVAIVHNETSSGTTSRVADVRAAIDRAHHGALLLVDTVSGLGCVEYRHDDWGVDVSIAASQKGLMLPPGLAFHAISEKARAHSTLARTRRAYWDWTPMLADNAAGFFPYTPSTNLLYGLREAILMLREEGLPAAFARHRRFGEATRAAVRAWGLELVCENPAEYSDSLTAVMMPDGHDADALRRVALERFDLSLGTGLGRLKGRSFRIGHLGDFNDLMLAATLCGVEMALGLAAVPFNPGGVAAALDRLKTLQRAAADGSSSSRRSSLAAPAKARG